jgi:hypothetical protein
MTYSQRTYRQAPQSKIEFNTRQIAAGAILMGVGGTLALAGAAVAGTAIVMAFRQRVQQMEVPPSELARHHWSRVKHATAAGVDTWRNEQQPAAQRRSA